MASTLTKLFHSTFTEVLSTARDTQLSHVIPFFFLAILVALKIETDVDDFDRYISCNFVTTLCLVYRVCCDEVHFLKILAIAPVCSDTQAKTFRLIN